MSAATTALPRGTFAFAAKRAAKPTAPVPQHQFGRAFAARSVAAAAPAAAAAVHRRSAGRRRAAGRSGSAVRAAAADAGPQRQVQVSHILLGEDQQELAAQLRQRIQGGEPLGPLAEQHSSCPSRSNGGSIGWVSRGQTVPGACRAAAAAAPPPPPPPPPPLDRTLTVGGARFLSTAPYIDSGAPLFGAGLLDNALSLVSTSAEIAVVCRPPAGGTWSLFEHLAIVDTPGIWYLPMATVLGTWPPQYGDLLACFMFECDGGCDPSVPDRLPDPAADDLLGAAPLPMAGFQGSSSVMLNFTLNGVATANLLMECNNCSALWARTGGWVNPYASSPPPPPPPAFEMEPAAPEGTSKRDAHKTRSVVLVNIASVLEKCDEQILPAVYAWVGASFKATPTQLGAITLGRAMMQALSSPLGGIAGHFIPRGTVIAIGCWIWAAMTALFALTTRLSVALPICAINGVGLALVIPNVQSLTADYYHASARGQAFGTLWLTISLGGMLGALYATNTAAHDPFGIEGWRFVFFSVACVSAVAGLLNHLFVYDPTFERTKQQRQQPGGASGLSDGGGDALAGGGGERLGATLKRLWGEVAGVVRIPTFGIIIVQGIVGSVPYASLIFLTLYFQLMGMTNFDASLLVAIYLAGGGLGGLLGGWIGDRVASRFPDHGRIVATQFSVIIGVPFALLLFKGLPMDGTPGTVWLYRATIAAFALLTAWPAPCCNNPAFAEIVPPAQRNLIYAFDRCFEGAMAAASAPLVGVLAEKWFGFSGDAKVTGDLAKNLRNAGAIGSALLAFTTIPWAFCAFVYSGLHVTYPRDRRRALERQRGTDERAAREYEFEADEDGVEEAQPLRRSAQGGRDSSPVRPRPSPTRMAADADTYFNQQSLRRGSADRGEAVLAEAESAAAEARHRSLVADASGAVAILQRLDTIPHLREHAALRAALHNAKAVAFITQQTTGLVVGVVTGTGFVVRRLTSRPVPGNPSSWSAPSYFRIRGLRFGVFAGYEYQQRVIAFHSDQQLARFLRGEACLGVDVTLMAGTDLLRDVAARPRRIDACSADETLALTLASGALASLSIQVGWRQPGYAMNRKLFDGSFLKRRRSAIAPQELLAGKFPPPDEFCELYRVLDRILEWRPWRR
ncbi:MFS general substrate transporter [Micractinium conductrix]|uniref:MFS general substrate transporter n=1 Tax=Micractinium conductrix TaxID=554055 RepID=A0A2P6VQ25_9CHLO|nr:MFS general substrate transporter [Micractinium conductrix]|eukprot:PSC76181.1 MFS general substrate transporter [Micractinium conductrix]